MNILLMTFAAPELQNLHLFTLWKEKVVDGESNISIGLTFVLEFANHIAMRK